MKFIVQIFPFLGILVLITSFFFYYSDKIEWYYFLMVLIFLSISSAVYLHFHLSYEKWEVLVIGYLGGFSLVCYKRQKRLSFFFLYFAIYFLYFYCVYNINVSSTLLSYIFYISLFFLYYWYFTFTWRFILRIYAVVKGFYNSYSLIKLTLWVFFVLFPALVNNIFFDF